MASKNFQVEQDIVGAVPDVAGFLYALFRDGRWDVARSGLDQYGSAYARRRGGKPFIVGLIPPDVEINFLPIERELERIGDVTAGSAQAPAKKGNYTTYKPKYDVIDHPDSFYKKLSEVAASLGMSPADLLAVLLCESGLNPQAGNHVDGDKKKPVQAKGLNQLTPGVVGMAGMTKEFWKNEYHNLSAEEQLPYVERFYKSAYKGKYTSATQAYVVNFAPAHVGSAGNLDHVLYDSKDAKHPEYYEQNKGLDQGKKGTITVGDMYRVVESAKKSEAYSYHMGRMEAVVGKDAAWAKPNAAKPGFATAAPGSPSTQPAAEPPKVLGGVMSGGNVTAAEDDDPLNRTGRNIRVSDRRFAVVKKQVDELKAQAEAARQVPGLLMLTNPTDFQRSYEHSVDAPKARGGHVVHMWLERPLSISCKGVSAAQYAVDASGSGGLTGALRTHSLSYRNLMSLAMLYRNNGQLFTGAASGQDKTGVPTLMMSVFIYYDGHIYIGSFDDFQVDDSADKPHNLAYSWKFTARYDIDVSHVTDDVINRATAMGGASQYAGTPPVPAPVGGVKVIYPDGQAAPAGAPVPSHYERKSGVVSSEGVASYYDLGPSVPKPGGAK